MTCTSPSLIIEVRPRLQVCHVFIKRVQAEAVQLERAGGELKIVYNEGRNSVKVNIPGTELKPQSLSNFTLLDQSEGTYFRIATVKCSLTAHAQSVSLFDYSARDTTYVPRVELNAPQALFCRCCGSRLMLRSVRFQRILPLPSDSWDMSDMFCHLHEGEEEHTTISSTSSSSSSLLHPKSGDLLYGAYNFVLSIANEKEETLSNKEETSSKQPANSKRPSSMLTCVRMSQRVVSCELCSFWLGTKQSESLVTLWNSTVEFKPVTTGNENEKLVESERLTTAADGKHVLVEQESRKETGTERLNDVTRDQTLSNKTERSKSKIGYQILPSKLETTSISEEDVENSHQCIGNKSGPLSEGNSNCVNKSSYVYDSNSGASPHLTDNSSHLINSQPCDSTAHHPNLVHNSRLSPQDRIALSDFIAVVKDNLGINSKLLIQCQVTDSSLQSLLLWIMDRNLILCTSSTDSEGLTNDLGFKQDQNTTEESSSKKSENNSKKELVKDVQKCGSCGKPGKILKENLDNHEKLVENIENCQIRNGGNKVDCGNVKNTKNNAIENQKDEFKTNKDTVDVPVKVYNVMKVLYTYAKDRPDPSWSKDFGLPHVNVSKIMFLNALKHLRIQERNIPTPYRFISEMNVSYIVLGT